MRWWAAGMLMIATLVVPVACDLLPAQAFAVTVRTDAADVDPGDGTCEATVGAGDCTLRAAVQEADAFVGETTITLSSGAPYVVSVPGAGEDLGATADLDITADVRIVGNGATVDGAGLDRVLDVRPDASLHLDGVTITGGRAPFGGGIANAGSAWISNSTITGNEADGFKTCNEFVYSLSCDGGRGGGGGIDSEGTANIWSTTIAANRSTSPPCVWQPHASQCYVQSGGGLNVSGTAGLVNVTISGNEEVNGYGAAIDAPGTATLVYATIADNTRTDPMGMLQDGVSLDGNLQFGASVVTGPDSVCLAPTFWFSGTTITSQGHNVFSDHSCPAGSLLPSDRQDTDGGLSPLGSYGGPTRTHRPGAALIDQVPATDLLCSSLSDQRGVARPVGGACDIGAVEDAPNTGPLLLNTDALPPATGLEAYLAPFEASGGTAPYSWELTGDLPSGLAWDPATHQISGTVGEGGTFTFTVTVTDAAAATASRTFELAVIPPSAVQIVSGDIPPAFVGRAYSVDLESRNGVEPTSWAFSGDLPDGLVWDPVEATITGVPTEAGVFAFSVTVTDSWGSAASIDGTLISREPVAFTSVAAGWNHTCAVVDDGSVLCWGKLGGLSTDVLVPTPIAGLSSVQSLSAGNGFTCAVLADATARCFGDNSSGQLGDGTQTTTATPVTVSGLTGVTGISAGSTSACATRVDGTVWCWGGSPLGDGTFNSSAVPVAVTGLTDADQVVASGSYACARRLAGTVACWGGNDLGQLGTGGVPDFSTVPVEVPGLTGVVDLTAGPRGACAVLADGSARCWGSDYLGQLGNGSGGDSLTPVPVVGLTGATTMFRGYQYACSLRTDASVWCQGSPRGYASEVAQQPVAVPGAAGATAISGSYAHQCAVMADASLRCWGDNSHGQLGLQAYVPALAEPATVLW